MGAEGRPRRNLAAAGGAEHASRCWGAVLGLLRSERAVPDDILGYGEGFVVEFGLLHQSPNLGKEEGPADKIHHNHGDNMFAEYSDAGVEEDGTALGLEVDFEGCLHAQDRLEDAALRDGDVGHTAE